MLYRTKNRTLLLLIFTGTVLFSCSENPKYKSIAKAPADSAANNSPVQDTVTQDLRPVLLDTKGVKVGDLVNYAKSLIGIPYLYGSADPDKGFDCSGFITYVFNHFQVKVPRSSADFEHAGHTIQLSHALPGDLILFTGTDSTLRNIGHMGIIASIDSAQIRFIHSTSGKANGVTITPLNPYYEGRFVKAVRVLKQHNE